MYLEDTPTAPVQFHMILVTDQKKFRMYIRRDGRTRTPFRKEKDFTWKTELIKKINRYGTVCGKQSYII